MEKNLSALLSALDAEGIEYQLCFPDGRTQEGLQDCVIKGLAFDSRDVKEGFLFFALPGTHTSGSRYAADAVRAGAAAVVFEGDFTASEAEDIGRAISIRGKNCVFIKVPSARFSMAPVSAAFYDNPSSRLIVFGVTGTEGKSSTVSFLWQLLRANGIRAGFISTVQYSLGGGAVDNSVHQTTPEAPVVQRELYEMEKNGCTHAVIECSSHGLSLRTNRLGNVLFDAAVFMNVTLEHLEFHGTYEQYKSDKANLFRALSKAPLEKTVAGKRVAAPPFGVVNLDDKAAPYFRAAAGGAFVTGFTEKARPRAPDGSYAFIKDIASESGSLSFKLEARGEAFGRDAGKTFAVSSRTPGAFNARNITAAILCANKACGIPLEKLCGDAENLSGVKGRMSPIDLGQDFEVIVDYAHTPSSFETIFPPLRARCPGRLIAVFGSGGERDVTKRPLQGEIAAKYCDIVVLTDEDPRKEDRMAILEQIAAGARKGGRDEEHGLYLVPDRPRAIRLAFSLARKGDIVLLLGKSHENSIIYSDRVMPYDEIKEAESALKELAPPPGRGGR